MVDCDTGFMSVAVMPNFIEPESEKEQDSVLSSSSSSSSKPMFEELTCKTAAKKFIQMTNKKWKTHFIMNGQDYEVGKFRSKYVEEKYDFSHIPDEPVKEMFYYGPVGLGCNFVCFHSL